MKPQEKSLGVCVWGNPKFPDGYTFLGAFMFEPKEEAIFYIGLPERDVVRMDKYQIARAVADMIRFEIIRCADKK